MRKTRFFILFAIISFASFSQDALLDTLNAKFKRANDSNKVRILIKISNIIQGNDPARAFNLSDSALTISKRINYPLGIGNCYSSKGSCLTTLGKFDQALVELHKGLKVFEDINARVDQMNTYNSIGNVYSTINRKQEAYEFYLKACDMASADPVNDYMVAISSVGVGNCLLEQLTELIQPH